LQNFEILQRRHAGHRMAVVGEPMWERRPWRSLVDQSAVDLLRYDAGTKRYIAAADAFGQRQHVGPEVPVLEREAFSGTAKARDYFVEDEQHAVLAADRLNRWPVARRGHNGPSGAHDRFADEGRDAVGPLGEQPLFQ